jgi:hypothetical protein
MIGVIEFISDHIIAISIVSLPLLYITIRDIVMYFRDKKKQDRLALHLQEQQVNLESLMKDLDDNRQSLMDSFQRLKDVPTKSSSEENSSQSKSDPTSPKPKSKPKPKPSQ